MRVTSQGIRMRGGVLAGLAALASAASHAQQPVDGLDEVVVTAQKRVGTEQTTPISMNVWSAEELVRKGISDIQSLSIADTSLNYSNGGSEGFIAIRGVLSKDVTEIGDPTVPVGQDWFFTNRPAQLINTMYDIERVEVLRGPQGTLYGRNATGGVVNIVTTKPGREFEARTSLELGNFNTLNFMGALNVPVSERIQVRGAFTSRRHDGYRENPGTLGSASQEGDDEDARSGRIQIAIQPTDNLDLLLAYQNTRIGGTGTVALNIPFVPSTTIPGDIVHELPDLGDPRRFPLGGPTRLEIEDELMRLQADYQFGNGYSLTYLGGYSDFRWQQWLPTPGLFTPPGVPNSFLQNEFPKTQNHELRLASDEEGFFTWQAGLYYFEERSTNLLSSAVADPGASTEAELLTFRFPLVKATSEAVFGQASFAVTDALSLTAGARYSRDEKTRTGVLDIPVFGIFGIPQEGSADFSKTTGHLGLGWTFNDDQFLYAKADTGYKAGGFTTCNPYDPEEVTTFEIGSKNRLRDDSIEFNVAAFYNDYKDQQVQTFVPASVCISNSTVQNAGSSEIYGLEAAFTALVDAVGRFDVSLTWLNARYDDFVAQPGLPAAAAGCSDQVPVTDDLGNVIAINCQLSGNRLSLAPDITIAAGYERSWTLADAATITGRIEGKFYSEQYYDAFNYRSTRQDDYALLNAYVDYERDNWRVGLWGRNLTDEVYFLSAQEFYTISTYQYAFAPPRTYGVRFDLSMD